jgi:hypothetical protein
MKTYDLGTFGPVKTIEDIIRVSEEIEKAAIKAIFG